MTHEACYFLKEIAKKKARHRRVDDAASCGQPVIAIDLDRPKSIYIDGRCQSRRTTANN